jgi:hypothetical protein
MQYKLEISNGWDETFVLESDCFEKLAAIQSFIVEQEADGWAEYLAEEDEEEELEAVVEDEEEELEVVVEDEEGTVWALDDESGEWYVVDVEEEDEE